MFYLCKATTLRFVDGIGERIDVMPHNTNLLVEFMQKKNDIKLKNKKSSKQIDIFNKSDYLLNELEQINLDKITPLEALNKLNILKDKIK